MKVLVGSLLGMLFDIDSNILRQLTQPFAAMFPTSFKLLWLFADAYCLTLTLNPFVIP